MIVRRKYKKEIPQTEYQFRVSLEKKDVLRVLQNYLKDLAEKSPELVDGYIYTLEELQGIFTNNTLIHHFSPSVQKDLVTWCIVTAEANGYIALASQRVCKLRKMVFGDSFFILRDTPQPM